MMMIRCTCTRSLADDTSGGCPPSSQITDSRYSSPCSRSNMAAVSSWYSPSPTLINRKLFSARRLSAPSAQSKRPLRPSSGSETTTCATNVPAASDSGTRATSALPDACRIDSSPSYFCHTTNLYYEQTRSGENLGQTEAGRRRKEYERKLPKIKIIRITSRRLRALGATF